MNRQIVLRRPLNPQYRQPLKPGQRKLLIDVEDGTIGVLYSAPVLTPEFRAEVGEGPWDRTELRWALWNVVQGWNLKHEVTGEHLPLTWGIFYDIPLPWQEAMLRQILADA